METTGAAPTNDAIKTKRGKSVPGPTAAPVPLCARAYLPLVHCLISGLPPNFSRQTAEVREQSNPSPVAPESASHPLLLSPSSPPPPPSPILW